MTKLYSNDAGAWQVPGKQDKKAERVDVPSSPEELAAWLNERRVTRKPLEGAELVGAILSHNPEAPPIPAADGAVITEEELERVNAQRPTFLGKLTAAEIERHRMAINQCPKCGNSAGYLHSLEETKVCDWLETADLDRIQRVVEHARMIVRDRGAVLEGEGRVN